MGMKRKTTINSVQRAVLGRSLAELKSALSAGEDVDYRDQDGRTALFQTIVDGSTELTSELISHGADVNARDKAGETSLHFAAREYRIDAAKLLLEHGAQVDAQDEHGNTPLARAVFASQGRGEMIKLLLSHSANRSLKNKYGVSAEDLAKSIANYDVKQFFDP
jgi:ankyrin repeat protein